VRPPAFLATKLAPPKTQRLPLLKKGTRKAHRNPRLRASVPRLPPGLPLPCPPALKLLPLPRKSLRLPPATSLRPLSPRGKTLRQTLRRRHTQRNLRSCCWLPALLAAKEPAVDVAVASVEATEASAVLSEAPVVAEGAEV
jgi:hypothetical protein